MEGRSQAHQWVPPEDRNNLKDTIACPRISSDDSLRDISHKTAKSVTFDILPAYRSIDKNGEVVYENYRSLTENKLFYCFYNNISSLSVHAMLKNISCLYHKRSNLLPLWKTTKMQSMSNPVLKTQDSTRHTQILFPQIPDTLMEAN